MWYVDLLGRDGRAVLSWSCDEAIVGGLGGGRLMLVCRTATDKVTIVAEVTDDETATLLRARRGYVGPWQAWRVSVATVEVAPAGFDEVMAIPVIPISEADAAIFELRRDADGALSEPVQRALPRLVEAEMARRQSTTGPVQTSKGT